jgi:peptidoglycan/LPS O-acetylase OafA/YrhL
MTENTTTSLFIGLLGIVLVLIGAINRKTFSSSWDKVVEDLLILLGILLLTGGFAIWDGSVSVYPDLIVHSLGGIGFILAVSVLIVWISLHPRVTDR